MTTPKSDQEWKEKLSPEQYKVLRKKGTERPYTGKYDKHFKQGMYKCAGCGAPLFESEHKFDAGCGWPSFDRAQNESTITAADNSLGMGRNEVLCKNCGGHLGHIFEDGPKQTTGQRFCINSAALAFTPKDSPKEKSAE